MRMIGDLPVSTLRHFGMAVLAMLALFPAGSALAGELLRGRSVPVNGRPVLEIRLSEVPAGNNLRAVVVTAGPTAGTTSLLTAVGTPDQWLDSTVLPSNFQYLVESGTVFSVGGGCTRGSTTDFPFINNSKPNVLRFNGGTATIIPMLTFDSSNFDSAECRAAPDGSRTTFVFSNRSTNRAIVVVDEGGPNDLNLPFVTFSSVLPPFLGGLRPQMSLVANRPHSVAFLWMETNGQTRWREFDTEAVNVDFNCLVDTQSPPPAGFTIPRGARTIGPFVVSDFDGNGQIEYGIVEKTSPAACVAGPVLTNAGPVAGTGFNFTEPAGTVTANLGLSVAIFGRAATWDGSGTPPTVDPGPHPGIAGPFAACGYYNEEGFEGTVSASAEQTDLMNFKQRLLARFENPPAGLRIMLSSFESEGRVSGFNCDERGLRQ